jgi:ribosomal protein L4
LARKSALSLKVKKKEITILEDLNLKEPKTKSFKDVVNALGLGNKKLLFVTSDVKHKFFITQSKGINDILK